MVKNYKVIFYVLLYCAFSVFSVYAKTSHTNSRLAFAKHNNLYSNNGAMSVAKLTFQDSLSKDSLKNAVKSNFRLKGKRDSLIIMQSKNVPNLSLQQMLKGNIAGLYVQETTSEPGTEQSMLIQGASSPIFTKRDIYAAQPAVYVNGVYLAQENPFAFDVQKYDYNRIGPATNLLANIDIDNVQSIEVIKEPMALAKLGPNAANGAIWITMKPAKSGLRQIDVNAYTGIVPITNVQTVNGAFENNFRRPFYQKYATPANYSAYASFLRDSTNTDYFGSSNWNDLYYNNAAIYAANLGITGGTERANFRFYGTGMRNASNADATGLNKYNAYFAINMMPFSWMSVSSYLSAARMDRERNKSLRDRFAEVRYLPDLSSPLSPNKSNYQLYLAEYDKVLDENRNNLVNGSLSLNLKIARKLNFNTSLIFDYNEGIRNAFFPSTLMDGTNYVSGYFGFNQRFGVNNVLSYEYELSKDHRFDFEAGQSLQGDKYRYNYQRGYGGNSDFIKLNVVEGNTSATNYLNALSNFADIYRFTDRMESRLMSFFASAKYSFKDLLIVNALVRRDGSSTGQPNSRWITTPAINAEWNLKNHFLRNQSLFNEFTLSAGWAKSMKVFLDDRFGAGPQYRTEYGWEEEPTVATYNAVMGMSRPYNSGWVGYGLQLPHTNRFNFSAAATMLNGKLSAALSFYNRDDNNQLLNLPLSAESGYASIFKNGLDVNNKGVEALVSAVVNRSQRFEWQSSLNINYNKNEVRALPDGLQELIIGSNKLSVGKSVGAYWLYQNNGVYQTDADVPNNPANGKKMDFNGIALTAGDPKWEDINGDYSITDADKQLMGDRMPHLTGGLTNFFRYKNFDLNFHLFFALGQKAINQFDSGRYDFINREAASDINSVKELTSWQSTSNQKSYPVYNVWSNVIPYRVDQDLFLEDASYLKLRSVTLGYDLSKNNFVSRAKLGFRRAYVYATASNVFTVTSFSGRDPELLSFNGIYDGSGIPIVRTFILGVKLEL